VTEVLSELRTLLPFALLGLDTDNDSVFMNETVRDYCLDAGVEFTRCRPYRKNDQAWVEQKNGSVVRRTVGYRRFERTAQGFPLCTGASLARPGPRRQPQPIPATTSFQASKRDVPKALLLFRRTTEWTRRETGVGSLERRQAADQLSSPPVQNTRRVPFYLSSSHRRAQPGRYLIVAS
jgi:transposase